MKINSVKIYKLFDIFDYEIPCKNDENILIITGPNGYGKTMILNIIYNLFNKRLYFFRNLVFKQIKLFLEDDIVIQIDKGSEKHTIFSVIKKNKEVEIFKSSNNIEEGVYKDIFKYFPYLDFIEATEGEPEVWLDLRNKRQLNIDEIIDEYGDRLPERILENLSGKASGLNKKSPELSKILDSLPVHLIKEQRLFKKIQNKDGILKQSKQQSVMMESIQTYANELKKLITEYYEQYLKKTQALDSTYPDRLIQETNKLTKEEYENKSNKLIAKQNTLNTFGLYDGNQKFLNYSESDSKALTVYLSDLDSKLAVFDQLLEKITLFTKMLNERRFTFKSIHVSRDNGFFFKTVNDNKLELSQLSSGEQHQIVLLYELIFKTSPGVLVLIDEPEISLHVTWQKDFLNDLIKIIQTQGIEIIVATHSPAIINDRWDLVYNLEKIDNS